MQILEIKNNLLKISFEPNIENLVLSGFVSITSGYVKYISQVLNIEAKQNTHYAILKVIFKADDNEALIPYDGSSISLKSELSITSFESIMSNTVLKEPLYLGRVNSENYYYNVDFNFLKKNLLVCVEHIDEKDIFETSIVSQLINNNKKTIMFDLYGSINAPEKLTMGKDFKLPLNYDTINFIYEKGLTDASGETKAVVQDIFLEVQNYVKNIPEKFIPFQTFKEVVDAQYEETQIDGLVLLKNKLLKYYEKGIFAQDQYDFDVLKFKLIKNNLTVIDISKFKGDIQQEVISYVYSVLKEMNCEFYSFVEIEDDNTDKKLLKRIFTTEKVHSVIISPYKYKYLKEVKQLSKNLILFNPIKQQDDFAGYNIFLSRLNHNEFIAYGDGTMYVPCLLALDEKEVYENTEEDFSEQSLDSVNEEGSNYQNQIEQIENSPKQVIQEEIINPETNLETTKKEVVEPKLYEEIVQEEQFEPEAYTNNTEEELADSQVYEEVSQEEPFETQVYEQNIEDEDQYENQEIDYKYEETSDIDQQDDENYYQQEKNINQAVIDNVDRIQAMSASEFEQNETSLTEEDLDFIEENVSLQNSEELTLQDEIDNQPLNIDDDNEEDYNQPQYSSTNAQEFQETPPVPVYPAEKPKKPASSTLFEKGDHVFHEKFGKGVINKVIVYGDKTLFSIQFEESGKKFLNPDITTLTKI